MIKKLVNSKIAAELTDKNHIHSGNVDNRIKSLFDFNSKVTESDKRGYGIQRTITKWEDSTCYRNIVNDVLDVLIIELDNKMFWLPYVEYRMLGEAIKIAEYRFTSLEEFEISIGYIDGRQSHLSNTPKEGFQGEYPGYRMWIELQPK